MLKKKQITKKEREDDTEKGDFSFIHAFIQQTLTEEVKRPDSKSSAYKYE